MATITTTGVPSGTAVGPVEIQGGGPPPPPPPVITTTGVPSGTAVGPVEIPEDRARRASRALGEHIEHLRGAAPESDALLHAWADGVGAAMGREWLIAHGDADAGIRPWAAITDPRVAPLWALPHVAVWVGGELPARDPGESDAAYLERARHALIYPRGQRRGSIRVLRDAVSATLTGGRAVIVTERHNDDTHRVLVQTLVSETPDPDATAHAARHAPIDASLVVEHQLISGERWDDQAGDVWDDRVGEAWDDLTSS